MEETLYKLKNSGAEYPKLCGETFAVLLWRTGPLELDKKSISIYEEKTGEKLDSNCYTDEEKNQLRTNKKLIDALLSSQGGSKHGLYRTEEVPIEFNKWHLWSVHDAPKSAFSTNEVLCLNIKALIKIQKEIEKKSPCDSKKRKQNDNKI